jgi:hypothetical protein
LGGREGGKGKGGREGKREREREREKERERNVFIVEFILFLVLSLNFFLPVLIVPGIRLLQHPVCNIWGMKRKSRDLTMVSFLKSWGTRRIAFLILAFSIIL